MFSWGVPTVIGLTSFFCQLLAASLLFFVAYQVLSPLFWVWQTTWGAMSMIKDVSTTVISMANPQNYTDAV
jgi:hypothetical protein